MNRLKFCIFFIILLGKTNHILTTTQLLEFNETVHEAQEFMAACLLNIATRSFRPGSITCIVTSGLTNSALLKTGKTSTLIVSAVFMNQEKWTYMTRETNTYKSSVHKQISTKFN